MRNSVLCRLSIVALLAGSALPALAQVNGRFITLKNGACPLEFKSMNRRNAKWARYRGPALPAPQKATVFLVRGEGPDTVSFSVANPRGFFFKGSLACVSRAAGTAPSEGATISGPATPPPSAAVSAPGVDSAPSAPPAESGGFHVKLSIQPVLWKETLVFDATSGADEELSAMQFGAGAGLAIEQFVDQFSWGGEAQVWGGLSTVDNALPDAQVTTSFSATGFMVGVNLRPTAYYYFSSKRNRIGVGPYLSLLARYSAYAAATNGVVAAPFQAVVLGGASVRFVSGQDWGASLNGGFVAFKPSDIFVGLQLDF